MTFMPERKTAYGIAAILLAVLTVACLKKIYDYDIWYHLSIGREIVRSGAIPSTEFLVHTLQGTPTVFHAWGYGVICYLIQSSFGYWGLSLFNALLGAMAVTAFFLVAMERRPNSAPLALLLLVPLFPLVDFRFVFRPELFCYLFLGVELFLLERFLASRRWSCLYAVPVLCLLNNLHPSSIILLIVLALYCGEYVLERRRDGGIPAGEVGRLAGVMVAAVGISLCNPYGYLPLMLPFKMTGSEEYVRQVIELIPTLKTSMKWPALGVAAAAVASLLTVRPRRPLDWLLLLFFGYVGFGYVRSLPFFVFVTYPMVVAGVAALAGRASWLATSAGKRGAWGVAVVAVAGMVFYAVQKPTWGGGVVAGRFPERAADLLLGMKPPGRLFNSEDAGGYLGWRLYPEYQVSVDGRHFERDRSLVITSQLFDANPSWQKILADNDATTIFTPAVSPMTGVLVDLLAYLDQDEDWVLLSAEPAGLLFGNRRKVPAFRNVTMPDQNLIWWQVVETAKGIPVAHERANAYLSTSIAYSMLRRYDLSKEFMRKYVALTPGDVVAAQALQNMERGMVPVPPDVSHSTKARVF